MRKYNENEKRIREQLFITLDLIIPLHCDHNVTQPCVKCREKLTGDVSGIRGNVSGIRGVVTNITGNMSGITGDVSGITGDVSDITGDVTYIRGNVSGITGDASYIIRILIKKRNEAIE